MSEAVTGRRLERFRNGLHVLEERFVAGGLRVLLVEPPAPELLELPDERALDERVLALGRSPLDGGVGRS